jgi:uncharacterized delta-60 repeat protein
VLTQENGLKSQRLLGFWSGGLLPLCLAFAAACEGPQGAAGPAGADGRDGINGEDGEDGLDGDDGTDGSPGNPGTPGIAGLNGVDGVQGLPGLSGQNGSDGVTTTGGSGPALPAPGEAGVVSLSTTGHDRLFGVTFALDGNILATGQVSTDIDASADFSFVVAKFLPNGQLDRRFGNDGVVTKNVSIGGTARELARGIVVQSTGDIVIAGAAEHDPDAVGLAAQDTDVVLVRFSADGVLDTSFGVDGVARLDLSTAAEGLNNNGQPALLGADSQWGLALGAGDSLIVHGTQRAEGLQADGVTPRTDSDWALVKLTADGDPDLSFSTDGKVTLDIGEVNASARAVTVLPDGSIIGTGYTTSTVLGISTQQPVLYKVSATGAFDETFATADAIATPGVWHDFATDETNTALRAEAYGAAVQGDNFVTIGYGPTPTEGGTGTDWVSFRFTATGEQDLTFGDAGRAYIDAGGFGDNGRFVMTLPDNRILGVGVGRRAAAEQPERDAMIAVLTADGLPDTSFAPNGFKLFDVGGDADHFWAAGIAPEDPTQVAIVGIAGGRTTGVNDDDALLLLLPLED